MSLLTDVCRPRGVHKQNNLPKYLRPCLVMYLRTYLLKNYFDLVRFHYPRRNVAVYISLRRLHGI